MIQLKFAILYPCISEIRLTQGLRLVNNVKRMMLLESTPSKRHRIRIDAPRCPGYAIVKAERESRL